MLLKSIIRSFGINCQICFLIIKENIMNRLISLELIINEPHNKITA